MTMPTYAQAFEAGARAPWGIDPNGAGDHPPTTTVDPASAGPPPIIPYEAVLAHVQGHPTWQSAMVGQDGGLDWDSLLDHGAAPGDPAGQERWVGARAALERVKPLLKEREARLSRYLKQRDYHAAMALLKQSDHLFERTLHLMEHYLERLPGVLRRLVMPHLASEFGAFAELYRYLRHGAALVEHHAHARSAATKARAESRPKDGEPSPTTREDERAALVRRVKSGGAREGDLLRYLELSGVGE